ncbi:MAG: BrxE family protein [Kaiparowitsia implicata GSE-PSE-MK54-09C]|jgi:hypothetical protein|nr:BrxE family protein [Kaiparowitsia implicata GSE-PSE-MK54-09C]
MSDLTLDPYSQLRLLVGYLGEKNQKNWWSTAFFDATSKLFLEPIVPRTVRLAQYKGVHEAARRLHDEHVAVGGIYHLFRLPEEVEQDLQQRIIAAPEEWFAPLISPEQAMATLETLAEAPTPIESGPQSLGQYSELYCPAGTTVLARHYLSAFRQNIRSYPYFTR